MLAGTVVTHVPGAMKGQTTLKQLYQVIEVSAFKGVLHLGRGIALQMAATLRPRGIEELVWERVSDDCVRRSGRLAAGPSSRRTKCATNAGWKR